MWVSTQLCMLFTFNSFSGNHAFAIVCGKECYENMAKSSNEVFEEINTVISEGEIIIEGEKIKQEFCLGGDYKVLVILIRNPQKILLADL